MKKDDPHYEESIEKVKKEIAQSIPATIKKSKGYKKKMCEGTDGIKGTRYCKKIARRTYLIANTQIHFCDHHGEQWERIWDYGLNGFYKERENRDTKAA